MIDFAKIHVSYETQNKVVLKSVEDNKKSN